MVRTKNTNEAELMELHAGLKGGYCNPPDSPHFFNLHIEISKLINNSTNKLKLKWQLQKQKPQGLNVN
ncbi:MAG: hypothetical protein JWQ54_4995 [Mucilaginibacter sp.]|nr:hypothetical protein [Mucilaginibacter sp.]